MHDALRAVAEGTRLRILALLAEAELTVSDLTEILRQSQPRISRHLKLLPKPAWSSATARAPGPSSAWPSAAAARTSRALLVERLDPADPVVARDRERLAAVRAARAAAAQDYFRAHAAEWDRIRKLHVADEAVEAAIVAALADKPFRSLLDLGTGTGRMLELFGAADRARARHRSVARHAAARARAARARRPATLQRAPGRHLRSAACRSDSFDVVIIHQVLHYLDDGARAIREAARVLRAGRPAADRRFRAARSRIPARGARASPARLRAGDGDAMARSRGPRRRRCTRASRRSRLRRQDRGVALARARPAHRGIAGRRGGGMIDIARTRQPLRARRAARRIRVSFEFFPPKTEEMEAHALGGDRRGSRRLRRISCR